MNTIQKLKTSFLALVAVSAFTACSDDDTTPSVDNDKGKLGIYASASYAPNKNTNTAGRTASVEVSRFRVNLEEIELEYDEIIDENNLYNSEDEIELRGPFEVDLLSPEPVRIVDITLPNGRLEEIEFEFDKSDNPASELHNKSMLMEGTINDIPFVFWHDFEEEIEIEFDDDGAYTVINNDENGILINFDLYAVLNGTPSVDLSLATDGNGDGIIEISPSDTDGNQALAEALKQAIKQQIDILEEQYD